MENSQSVLFFHSRVEDRNDPLVQKIRRYVNVFSRDDEPVKEKEEPEKTDITNDPMSGSPLIKPLQRGGTNTNRKSLRGWQMIRRSALGLETEKGDHLDVQEIKYV